MMHAGQRIAKGLVARAGTLWPKTTADFAFRLFTRSARRKGTSGTTGMPEGVRPLMLQHAGGLVATWDMPSAQPIGRKALLVHGWNSRSLHLLALARSLNDAGIDTVLLDLPGHGASTGRHLHLGKGIEAVDAAWRHHGPFDVMIGHSFGGAVVLNTALGSAMCVPARRPKRLVTIGAPNSLPALFRWFGRRIGLPPVAQEALERRVLSLLGRSLDLFVAGDQLADTDLPVLVIHDMDDTDVLYTDALRMARAGRHVRLHTTSGLGHRRVLRDEGVHAAIAAYVTAGQDDADEKPIALVRDYA